MLEDLRILQQKQYTSTVGLKLLPNIERLYCIKPICFIRSAVQKSVSQCQNNKQKNQLHLCQYKQMPKNQIKTSNIINCNYLEEVKNNKNKKDLKKNLAIILMIKMNLKIEIKFKPYFRMQMSNQTVRLQIENNIRNIIKQQKTNQNKLVQIILSSIKVNKLLIIKIYKTHKPMKLAVKQRAFLFLKIQQLLKSQVKINLQMKMNQFNLLKNYVLNFVMKTKKLTKLKLKRVRKKKLSLKNRNKKIIKQVNTMLTDYVIQIQKCKKNNQKIQANFKKVL
ncbi:hypothetical protein ABPG72_014046, partial [Tetrahymena utriculariae]